MSAQKQVTFGDLTITEYPIIMGDNPACNGCPITIGWGKFFLCGHLRPLSFLVLDSTL